MPEVDRAVAPVLAAVPTELFIAGRWRPATGAQRLPVVDPSTGQELCTVADAQSDDAEAAVASSAAAQAEWAATTSQSRADLLTKIHAALLADRDRVALLITLETGKPRAEAQAEVDYAAGYFAWYAAEATRVNGSFQHAPDGDGRTIVTYRPVGPCLLITPWNFPLAMLARKLGPALAAGCSSIVKPAAETPLSTAAIVQIAERSGVPAGVINLLPTSDPAAVVQPLLRDPRLRKLSFTGSTTVGRRLLRSSAEGVLRASMELGGNAPFIVCADADLDLVIEQALHAKCRNAGQACTAANRFLVHESVAPEFCHRFADRLSSLTVGPGIDPDSDVGPLISATAVDKVTALVRDATAHGATIHTGGQPLDRDGFFYAPTLLSGITDDARIAHEEIFGPIAAITTFTNEADAIRRANATEFGLASYLFTQDLSRGMQMSEQLESGMVGINTARISRVSAPFGGMKASGLGREGGPQGIGEYLEVQYLAVPR